jgi:hypothetical protein
MPETLKTSPVQDEELEEDVQDFTYKVGTELPHPAVTSSSSSSPSSFISPNSTTTTVLPGNIRECEQEPVGAPPQVPPTSSFRGTIGKQFVHDIFSGQYTYDDVIAKYVKLYPEYSRKFTRDFCSKVRCGRIMNDLIPQRKETPSNGGRMKRVLKVSRRKPWTKMTPELFEKILQWEKDQGRAVKKSEIEAKWNVNRTTYHRWKRNYGIEEPLNNFYLEYCNNKCAPLQRVDISCHDSTL